MMKKATEEILSELGERVFSIPVQVLWKTSNPVARNGERASQSRGMDGYEIASRQEYEPGDVGWTMQFGTKRVIKSVLSAELTASILACAAKTQDRTKVLTVSATAVESRIGPRGAKAVFAPAMEAILEPPDSIFVEPQPVQSSKLREKLMGLFGTQPAAKPAQATAASGMSEALGELGRKKSLVFVLSDFLSLSEADKEALTDAAAVHDLVCLVIQDERERELPSGRGMYTLKDIVSGETTTVWLNDVNRAQFRANAQKKLEQLCAFFGEANCDWDVLSTEQDFDDVIQSMMRLFGGHRR
jgi:uncharacterized protein (DUF58 family)